MKSSATTALIADDEPKPRASKLHTANAAGIFEDAEQIFVSLGAGNICHFLVANSELGWVPGFKLFTRQPRNLNEHLPKATDGAYQTRRGALEYCVDCADKFFAEHPGPRQAIATWWAKESDVSTVPAFLDKLIEDTAKNVRPKATDGVLPVASPAIIMPAGLPPRPHFAEIPLDQIEANPDNPRKDRPEADVVELANSIKANGLLQPVAVRDMGEGRQGKPDTKRYRLIFGEGRWLAHQHLNMATIEAKVFTGVDAPTALAFALVENLQRRDMNAIDEAEGFAELSRMSWTPERMAEQTGKSERTIYRALSLMKLPESVRLLVRSGELSARRAFALVRWVAAAPTVAADEFVARPRVCAVIADVASKSAADISSDELAAGVPDKAVGALLSERLIAEVPAKYWGRVREGRHEFRSAGRLYTFALDGWKALKKTIDTADREAAARSADKAKTKVANQVSVTVAELKKGKANVVELSGLDEIYIDYLPKDACAPGIADDQSEVIVCLKPDLLRLLKEAEAKALEQDREDRIMEADERAQAKLKKLKRVTGREMAFVLESTQYSCSASLDTAEAWKAAGLKFPRNADKIGLRQMLEALDPVDQFRLFIHSMLCEAHLGDSDLVELLCWILEVPTLGFIGQDQKARETLLSQLSADLWPAATPTPFEEPVEKPSAKKATKAKKPAKKSRR
jgi:ParB family transcriptional regulator, chromosome partitioning protein